DKLEETVKQDLSEGFTPFCVVGNAGTVNTGAIDDMEGLSKIARKYKMWFHVDGAYGGLLGSLPSIQEKYKGIELADSLAVDFHKWLYQTFEGGCLLVKDWDKLRRAYFKKASYLDARLEEEGRVNFNEHYFQLSRNAKALKIWMSLKAYGILSIQDMIQKDIDLAKYLANKMEVNPNWELVAHSDLAIACFRYVGNLDTEEEIDAFNRAMIPALEKDGRVFITSTTINNQFVIRACLINHRMHEGTVDYLINTLEEVATEVYENQESIVS
ncbi:MAG: pyridoxal-dependent decarboxylase, partial [Bacteroidota bacterium]